MGCLPQISGVVENKADVDHEKIRGVTGHWMCKLTRFPTIKNLGVKANQHSTLMSSRREHASGHNPSGREMNSESSTKRDQNRENGVCTQCMKERGAPTPDRTLAMLSIHLNIDCRSSGDKDQWQGRLTISPEILRAFALDETRA